MPALANPKRERKSGNRGGRPTKFDQRYIREAEKLGMLGATDEEMAAFWAISVPTFYAWQKAHPEFLKALKAGKIEADSDVALSLYKRATGYSHKAVKIFNDRETGVTEVPYTEHYPPDATSMIFWLKNRQRNKWRDKTDSDGAGVIESLLEWAAAAAQRRLEREKPLLIENAP